MGRVTIAVGAALGCVAVQAASSASLTECGASDGYAYYFAGGVVRADEAGLKKDGVDGRIFLNVTNDKIELLMKDATGATASTSEMGGKLVKLRSSENLIALMVEYEHATDTYIFQLDSNGDGAVAWSTVRTDSILANKISLMKARCRNPRR